MSRKNPFTFTPERLEEISKPGSKDVLVKLISDETGVDEEVINKTISRYVMMLTPLQSTTIIRYYLNGRTKIQVQYELGKNSVSEMERVLNRGVVNLCKIYSSLKER